MAQWNPKRPVLSGEIDSIPKDDTTQKDGALVQLSQRQLDELIGRAYARGARKGKREAADSAQDYLERKAPETLRVAGERLLFAMVREAAVTLGLSAKGAQTALRLMDFSGCVKDGEVNETAVKGLVIRFLQDYPEFSIKRRAAGRKASSRRKHAWFPGDYACTKQTVHTIRKGRRPFPVRQIRQAAFPTGDGVVIRRRQRKEHHP